ncbi:MAG: YggT family protein [Acidimicrobiales bacterium]
MSILCYLLSLYLFVLFLRIVLSWFPMSGGGALATVYNVLVAITEPVLAPLREVLPPVRFGAVALDLSPIVVFFVIQILLTFLCR